MFINLLICHLILVYSYFHSFFLQSGLIILYFLFGIFLLQLISVFSSRLLFNCYSHSLACKIYFLHPLPVLPFLYSFFMYLLFVLHFFLLSLTFIQLSFFLSLIFQYLWVVVLSPLFIRIHLLWLSATYYFCHILSLLSCFPTLFSMWFYLSFSVFPRSLCSNDDLAKVQRNFISW